MWPSATFPSSCLCFFPLLTLSSALPAPSSSARSPSPSALTSPSTLPATPSPRLLRLLHTRRHHHIPLHLLLPVSFFYSLFLCLWYFRHSVPSDSCAFPLPSSHTSASTLHMANIPFLDYTVVNKISQTFQKKTRTLVFHR